MSEFDFDVPPRTELTDAQGVGEGDLQDYDDWFADAHPHLLRPAMSRPAQRVQRARGRAEAATVSAAASNERDAGDDGTSQKIRKRRVQKKPTVVSTAAKTPPMVRPPTFRTVVTVRDKKDASRDGFHWYST